VVRIDQPDVPHLKRDFVAVGSIAIEISGRWHAVDVGDAGKQGLNDVKVHHAVIVGIDQPAKIGADLPVCSKLVEAIRDACRRLRTVDLSGCELYTSCEPCALCVAAMRIAGIGKLYYAASLAQSGEAFAGLPLAARHPIDVEALRAEAGAPLEARTLPSEQQLDREAVEVLVAWAASRSA
jgi:tRNA(Arg) A34 adenosine deaminase TadA